jgi:hypothetical protein
MCVYMSCNFVVSAMIFSELLLYDCEMRSLYACDLSSINEIGMISQKKKIILFWDINLS